MTIRITRTITKNVSKCSECPYFESGGQEGSCVALEDSTDCYANLVGWHTISPRCPFLRKQK